MMGGKKRGLNKDNYIVGLYLFFALAVVLFIALNYLAPVQNFTTDDLVELIRQNRVEVIKIVVNRNKAEVYLKKPYLQIDGKKVISYGEVTFGSLELFEKKIEDEVSEVKKMYGEGPQVWYHVERSWFWELMWVGGTLFLLFMFFMMVRRGGRGFSIFNFGRAQAFVYEKDKGGEYSFKDVAGLNEVKAELMEVVDFLKNPSKYARLGARIPKGILLIGPPGTGKTLLARAVASEAGVPFLSISGSEFVEMFVGVGASRVRDLFNQAKEKAPCIIFIDEIDAIGRARGKLSSITGNEERENTLNQLLTEMDGFKPNTGIIVIAATNRPDILDKALTRPGRFDRMIYLDLPTLEERKEIFRVHISKIKANIKESELEVLARHTSGLAGADIANICNEAALIAAKKDKNMVEFEDMLQATEKVVMGIEKKSRAISEEEKWRVAVHESGHVLMAWFMDKAPQVLKVSIVPRGKSLGAAWYLPEDKYIQSKEEMECIIRIALAGRAAEEVILGDISTGAVDDLARTTKMAYSMVAIAGMDEKLGNISFYEYGLETEMPIGKPYSEETAKIIDERVREIINRNYEIAKNFISQHRELLLQIAEKLKQKETLMKEEIAEIIEEYRNFKMGLRALPSP